MWDWGYRGRSPLFFDDGCFQMSDNDRSRRSGVVLEKSYQFLLWLVPLLDNFPNSQKFLLGDRIQGLCTDILEGLVEATYSKNALPHLAATNIRLEKLRFLFRLTHELKLLDARRYEFAARAIDEIGRLVGGWIKASRAVPA